MHSDRALPYAVIWRLNCIVETYLITYTEDSSPSHPPNVTLFVPPPLLLCCLVSLSDIYIVILEILQTCLFFTILCGGTTMGRSSNELPLER